MHKLVIHPTNVAQWQALVKDAEVSLQIDLSEEVESYLVYMLMRFIASGDLCREIIAIDFLESANKQAEARKLSLQEIGDKCLLFSGFFPEIARKRQVTVKYYVDIGRTAYKTLGQISNNESSALFNNLGHTFMPLVDILQAMRNFDTKNKLDPLMAEEVSNLGSKQARLILSESLTDANNYFIYSQSRPRKH